MFSTHVGVFNLNSTPDDWFDMANTWLIGTQKCFAGYYMLRTTQYYYIDIIQGIKQTSYHLQWHLWKLSLFPTGMVFNTVSEQRHFRAMPQGKQLHQEDTTTEKGSMFQRCSMCTGHGKKDTVYWHRKCDAELFYL